MSETLLTVILGFLLTTVIGSYLGYLLQQRSWSHQHRVQAAADRREKATLLFDELSRLLDKRLYRMRRLYWSLIDDRPRQESEEARARMAAYVAILYEWNDSINRNLALLQSYFGHQLRAHLDDVIGASFRDLGADLEQLWKEEAAQPPSDITHRFSELADLIYHFNLDMIALIDRENVEGATKPAVVHQTRARGG
jgi:hypothetical protein